MKTIHSKWPIIKSHFVFEKLYVGKNAKLYTIPTKREFAISKGVRWSIGMGNSVSSVRVCVCGITDFTLAIYQKARRTIVYNYEKKS